MSPRAILALLAALSTACGGGSSAIDAGLDAGAFDAGRPDAARDASLPDAGPLPDCGSGDPLALSQCVEEPRYRADLEAIAMPRPPASMHWQAMQDLCASRLESLGYAVELHRYATGVNVIGTRMGTTESEHRVLIGAHYDHIDDCAGADDNASGVAGVLEAARVLAMLEPTPRTLVIACWDEEERGLVGSRAYVERASAAGEIVDASFDFEMIGFVDEAPGSQRLPTGFGFVFPAAEREWQARERRGDFVAIIGDPRSSGAMTSLERYADRIGLPLIPVAVPAELLDSPALADLRRSDHASFWDREMPGIMITDTSEFRYSAYHCASGPDVVANLDTEFAAQVTRMTVAAAAEALGVAAR